MLFNLPGLDGKHAVRAHFTQQKSTRTRVKNQKRDIFAVQYSGILFDVRHGIQVGGRYKFKIIDILIEKQVENREFATSSLAVKTEITQVVQP